MAWISKVFHTTPKKKQISFFITKTKPKPKHKHKHKTKLSFFSFSISISISKFWKHQTQPFIKEELCCSVFRDLSTIIVIDLTLSIYIYRDWNDIVVIDFAYRWWPGEWNRGLRRRRRRRLREEEKGKWWLLVERW